MVQSEMFPSSSNVKPDVRERLDRALEVLVRLEQLAQQGASTASVSEVLGTKEKAVAMEHQAVTDSGYPPPVVIEEDYAPVFNRWQALVGEVLDGEFRRQGCCTLGQKAIAAKIGCSVSTVESVMRILRKEKFVQVRKRMRQGIGRGVGAATGIIYPRAGFMQWYQALPREQSDG